MKHMACDEESRDRLTLISNRLLVGSGKGSPGLCLPACQATSAPIPSTHTEYPYRVHHTRLCFLTPFRRYFSRQRQPTAGAESRL